MNPIAVSCFSGAMGLDLGLEKAGFKFVVAVETDSDARATIGANRPGLPLLGDLRTLSAAQVRAAAGLGDDQDIDLVAGGPPCKQHSTAGKIRGKHPNRGDLLFAYVNLATELHPRYIVVENVRGLVTDKEVKEVFGKAVGMLRRAGYVVSYRLYDAAYFGAPQNRDRVIVIASRDGRCPWLVPTNSDRTEDNLPPWLTLRDAIGDLAGIEHHGAKYDKKRLKWWRMLKPGQDGRHLPREAMTKTCIKATGGKPGYYRRLSWERPAPTLMTNPSNFLCGCCHPTQHRPLSVEEYRRLQGFPDSWQVCGSTTSKYRQIGNAVPVPLGEAIGKTIVQHMHTKNSVDPRPGFLYSKHRTMNDNIERANMNTLELLNQVCAGMGNPPIPPPLPPASFSPCPDITCYQSDFRRLPITGGSVDAIITDIPWATDWLPNVEEFAAWCAKVLKPGGIMATLYTAYNLDKLLARLSKHLHYFWTCVSPMHGSARLHTPFVTRCCTLCVVYSSTDTPHIHRSPCDLLPYSWREKNPWHENQQSLSVVQHLVEHFAREGDLICDPTSGGWTTMEAAWRTGRKFVGGDIRPHCLDLAQRRFAYMQGIDEDTPTPTVTKKSVT